MSIRISFPETVTSARLPTISGIIGGRCPRSTSIITGTWWESATGSDRLIWIEAHHVLSEAQRATDQEGFDVFEPASLFHLPHGSADREDVQIAGFKKPDDAILFVALDKVLRFIETGSGQIDETIHAAAEESAGDVKAWGRGWRYSACL